MTNDNLKVAIYARLSEKDRNLKTKEDDSNSIINQKSLLTDYALKQGWTVYDYYVDDDYSGSDRNRPEFNRMIDDARDGKFSTIICKEQSRFARDVAIVEKYLNELFPIWGIRFISIVDNNDTNDNNQVLLRQFQSVLNEQYLRGMSNSIKSVLTNRRENGYFIGAFAPYGYKKDPDKKGHLIPDEEAAKIVNLIFQKYADGMGKKSIAIYLNNLGIPNPTEYKRLHGIRKNTPKEVISKIWRYSSIESILKNEVYNGNLVQRKYESISFKTKINKPTTKDRWIRVENTHEPIVSKELWDRVQETIKLRTKPCYTGERSIFSGKVKCMYCKRGMNKTISKHIPYLRCEARKFSKDVCRGSCVSFKTLTNYILKEINNLNDSYFDEEYISERVKIKNDKLLKLEDLKKTQTNLENKILDYDNFTKNLYVDKIKGVITEIQFLTYRKDFENEKKSIITQLNNTRTEILKTEQSLKKENDVKNIVSQFKNVTELNREMLDVLIDKIYVGGTKNNRLIEIKWNF